MNRCITAAVAVVFDGRMTLEVVLVDRTLMFAQWEFQNAWSHEAIKRGGSISKI